MRDICLCGHGRLWHYLGYQDCDQCSPGPKGEFRCEPGTCDRFTWDPKGEDQEPARGTE